MGPLHALRRRGRPGGKGWGSPLTRVCAAALLFAFLATTTLRTLERSPSAFLPFAIEAHGTRSVTEALAGLQLQVAFDAPMCEQTLRSLH